jgi:putative endopeptidase
MNIAASLHGAGIGAIFSFGPMIDSKDSTRVVASLSESGGLGLGDKDFYENEGKKEIRGKYQVFVADLLVCCDLAKREEAEAAAAMVLALETEMAHAQWTRTQKRDPVLTYNKVKFSELAGKSGLDWASFLSTHSPALPGLDLSIDVIVDHPEYFTEFLPTVLKNPERAEHWRWYLKFHLARALSPFAHAEADRTQFEFFGKVLQGQQEQKPDWKRFISLCNGLLRDVLGELYASEFFPAEATEAINELVALSKATLETRIDRLGWMSAETKVKAKAKLATMGTKVGRPRVWDSHYDAHLLRADVPLVENLLVLKAAQERHETARINCPVDRDRWEIGAQILNAYYYPEMNEIVFPAAILQPPVFSRGRDVATDFGAIGAVILHEITHALDDQGSQYDERGNLSDWWTEADKKSFASRVDIIVEQFNAYTVTSKNLNVNGRLCAGENVADLGGLAIAYEALQNYIKAKGRQYETKEGFTMEQRFFLAWARTWATNIREERAEQLLVIDPHSPPHLRVNGPLSVLAEFHEAFGIKEGDKMWLDKSKRPEIW